MARSARAPWKRENPRKRAGKAAKHLSPAKKAAAKARARRAGRRYPNLVDNMRMAAKKTKKSKEKIRKKHAGRSRSAVKQDREEVTQKRPVQTSRERSQGRTDRGRPQGLCAQARRTSQAGRHEEGVRDDAAGHASQGKLGRALLRAQEVAAVGRPQRPPDTARAVRACLGRAGAAHRGRGAPNCRQRRTAARALPSEQEA